MITRFNLYMTRINEVLNSFNFGLIAEIVINIIIFYVVCRLLDIFEKSLGEKILSGDRNSQSGKLLKALSKIIKFIIFFIMFAAFLQTRGYSVSSLIAGFGITGLAVGFAANTTLANVFGTLSIIADKSFKIGDYIKTSGFEGTVEEINMRSTKIRTLDNFLTIIPNSVIANTAIINVTAGHKRRIFETFSVTYDTSDKKLKSAVKILEDILNNTHEISKDFVVYLETLSDSSIDIKVNAYVKTKNYVKYLKEREKFILEVIKQFRAEGIDFAFPSRTVYIAKDDNEN